MAFYLTIPGGNISLQKLTQFTLTRFQFLTKIVQANGDQLKMIDVINESVQLSECLIEGSVKDKISHFMLRVVCTVNSDLAQFFIAAETLLFEFRFSCMNTAELCKLFKSLNRHIQQVSTETLKCRTYSEEVRKILRIYEQIRKQFGSWRTVVEKYLQSAQEYFTVPFQSVLPLVAARHVILRKGIASVPIYKLRSVVSCFFKQMLQSEMHVASQCLHIDDERILCLVKTIKVLYQQCFGLDTVWPNTTYSLSCGDVDTAQDSMPPCMAHLHRTLRHNHRLTHHDRIQYTLFLKEAGLGVHDAVTFWRNEYSYLPSNQTKCCHGWEKNERRYTYSIRHLYGLEGSRINYRAHSCASLQDACHGAQEGGCPFAHFDAEHLTELLHTEGITGRQQLILDLAVARQYSQACQVFYQEKTACMTDSGCEKHQHLTDNVQRKSFENESRRQTVCQNAECVAVSRLTRNGSLHCCCESGVKPDTCAASTSKPVTACQLLHNGNRELAINTDMNFRQGNTRDCSTATEVPDSAWQVEHESFHNTHEQLSVNSNTGNRAQNDVCVQQCLDRDTNSPGQMSVSGQNNSGGAGQHSLLVSASQRLLNGGGHDDEQCICDQIQCETCVTLTDLNSTIGTGTVGLDTLKQSSDNCITNNSKHSDEKLGSKYVFSKPLDYFQSYQNLLRSLKPS